MSPFFEPDLEKMLRIGLKKKLIVSNDFSLIKDCNIIVVAVGTPQKSNGAIELSIIKKAITTIGKILGKSKNNSIVLIKSTVIPGTMQNIILPILEKSSGKKAGKDFGLISNPEFLQESSAVKDTKFPHVVVLGGYQTKYMKKVKNFFAKFHPNVPIIITNHQTAEMIKYANNSFLATKISFINQLANLCQNIPGANIDDIAKTIGLDPRIGKSLLTINFFFNPILNIFSKSGSKNGDTPLRIFVHLSLSISIATTLFPFDANTLASGNPTKPKPIIAIFMFLTKLLILKIMPS